MDYIYYTGQSFEAWVVAIITMERFVAVMFPHKSKSLITKKRAYLSVFIALGSNILFFIPALYVGYFDEEYGGCLLDDYKKLSYYVEWATHILRTILPLSIIFFANICILVKVFRSVKEHQNQVQSDLATSRSDMARSLTITLLTVSITFFILSLPQNIFIISQLILLEGPLDFTVPLSAHLYLAFRVSSLFNTLNYCINFFLYCISGARFRSEFRAMMTCKAGGD